jgi:hypothetical protein
MKFIKDNWVGMTMIYFTLFCETFHLLFKGVPFDDYLNLDDAIYYLINQLGAGSLITALIIFNFTPKEKIASRLMLGGVTFWHIKELIDEVSFICKINYNVYYIGPGWIVFLLTIFILAMIGYSKYQK